MELHPASPAHWQTWFTSCQVPVEHMQVCSAVKLKKKTGNFVTASETTSSASVTKSGFEDGWTEDSMVANKLGMFMWSTDQTHKARLVDQLSTMELRPNVNPVLAAKGHMQYKWFRSKLKRAVGCQAREDEAQCTYGSGRLTAHIAVDD